MPSANDSPQQAAESLRSRIAGNRRFTCTIHGPFGSGKTTALAALVGLAVDQLRLTLNEIAVFAATPLAIRHLRNLIGRHWPDIDPQTDLFARELSGIPMDAMRGHTALPGDDAQIRYEAVTRHYVDVLARLGEITLPPSETDRQFLDSLKPRVRAAINADHEARLDPSLRWPRNAYLDAVREYVAHYKAEHRLLDKADLVHGDYYVSSQVRLLLLDEISDNDRATITRYFPNASIITASRIALPADVMVELPLCLRAPECVEIIDPDPLPQLVPPLPADFASLFIISPPWRRGPWLAWLREQGIPPPASMSHWRAITAAWRLDQDENTFARAINPLLKATGLGPNYDDWLIAPGDIEGWTGWRDLSGRFDCRMRDHADAVLQRYGRLYGLPTIRIGMPWTLRHIEAEIVIADGSAGWIDRENEEIALSRATRQLISIKKPPR